MQRAAALIHQHCPWNSGDAPELRSRVGESVHRSSSPGAVAMALAAAAGASVGRANHADRHNRRCTDREGQRPPASCGQQGRATPSTRFEEALISGGLKWHPFFENALAGGGFTLGAGYRQHVSSHNSVDVRGSFTVKGYTRLETEFLAPRLFDRRGILSLTGAGARPRRWAFTESGRAERRWITGTNYGFGATLRVGGARAIEPTRGWLVLGAGVEASHWTSGARLRCRAVCRGGVLAIDAARSRLDRRPTALVWAAWAPIGGPAADYAQAGRLLRRRRSQLRRHGPGVRVHSGRLHRHPAHADPARCVRCCRSEATCRRLSSKDGQTIPFYMLPALGGGSSLRGFASWRFRDRNSVLLSADWRVLANHFLDVAVFYDAGKVVARHLGVESRTV